MNVARGAVLGGRFELRQRIGQGGIGEVWEAEDRAANRLVAVKLLRPLLGDVEKLAKRFVREGALIARVKSPFVCPLLLASVDASGTPFLVVERLVGVPLDRALPRARPLPLGDACRYMDHVLRGLTAVHGARIIHRDLKPGNVFIAGEGNDRRAVLIDFGIGKLLTDDSTNLTSDATTLGSPRYMAPEQLGGAGRADERCDVYAAATIAFRMLTGKLPFEGAKPGHVLALKMSYPAPSLAQRTGIPWPPLLEAFFARALARDVGSRPRSGAEAHADWAAATSGISGTGAREIAAGTSNAGGLTDDAEDTDRDEDDATPLLSRPRR